MFDDRRHVAEVDGKEVNLTAREWDMLAVLAQDPGKAYSIEDLCDSIFGYLDTNALRVYAYRLRKKVGKELVVNIPNFGYRFDGEIEVVR